MADDVMVMKALLGKLYTILMGGDATAPASTDSFVAWLAPGIPVDPDNLAFAAKGTTGKTGDEARNLLAQAADFSRIVNLVPDASGVIGQEHLKTTFENKGNMLWNAYYAALNSSQVADGDLTPEEEAKLKKFQGLLRTTKKEKNIVTEVETEVSVDGPVLVAYNEKMAAALDASTEYNNKRIGAMNADNPLIVQDWALNADNYRAKVRAANAAWISGGYKNEVNDMNAYIDQVTRRSLRLMKQDFLDQYARGKLTDLVSGGDFWITMPTSAGFATGKGWTKFDFAVSNVDTYSRSETNAWDAKLDVNVGLFKASAASSGGIGQADASVDVSNFKCSFELVQVPISRPWFAPEFLGLKSWQFDPRAMHDLLSDGQRPPKGTLVGYSTTCVFVRNLKMDFAELHNKDSNYAQKIHAQAAASYGPFVAASASYDRSVTENKFSSKITDDGLEVPGMQLIAMKCQLLPKSPDPDPKIKKWS
jgi:hypothetical protein